MGSKEDLLAASLAARFHSDCTSGLVQDLDVLMDLPTETEILKILT